MQKWLVGGILLAVLLIGGGVWFVSDNNEGDSNGSSLFDRGVVSEGNGIQARDQQPARVAFVDAVTLNQKGFVVIYDTDEEGNPKSVIGSSGWLPQGTYERLYVTLKRASRDGETLVAMLHSSNTDQIFRASMDPPLLNKKQEPFMDPFQISNEAEPIPKITE